MAEQTRLTKIAKGVKTGVQGIAALSFLGSIPVVGSVLTGLYLTEGSGMSLGQSSLIGAGVLTGAVALMTGASIINDKLNDKAYEADRKEAQQKLANEMNTSYNVYGDIKGKNGTITLVNKDRPDNYMIMKPDQDSVKVAISPTASRADYNNFLALSQSYAKENNVSLKLLDCEQTDNNVAADMQITKDGKTIHIPISLDQEKAALEQAKEHPDSSVKIDEFTEKSHWQWGDTKPELKEFVTYKQDSAKIEEPNMEKEAPSSKVSFKDNNISYGPAM